MKKTIVLLTVILMALSIVPSASASQVQYYPAELAYYDAQIDVMTPRLEAFQAQYYAVNGRYYQALTSHAAAPDVPTLPDGIDESPTDQPETLALFWESFAELPSELAWSFRIDTYSGEAGDGYVLSISTVINDQVWQRAINYGPESSRSAEWYQVIPFSF